MPLALTHRVHVADPRAHAVDVALTVCAQGTLPERLVVYMPVWTPGSYLVREHPRNIERLACDPPARATKVRKNAWRLAHDGAREVTLRYRLYCNELSVRTNHVDASHAFLTGAATFLAVEGHDDAVSTVTIDAPEGWRTVTSLAPASTGFVARGTDALFDAAIEVGRPREASAEVLGKPLRVAFWPADAIADDDARRLVDDTCAILRCEAHLFGGELPYDDYLLLAHLQPRARAGLEHASSAVVLVSPGSFRSREGYLEVLSLVAHESLHAWNVKRIRPEGLVPLRYQEECYTRLLWWFEGATSYYDWAVLRRAGLCSTEEYLDHVAREVSSFEGTPGRRVQSLEDASFDAWIKAYRPDENSSNTTVSYYRKGELACLVLDLEIRARTRGARSLDDVLAYLWRTYGVPARPVPEDAMPEVLAQATGLDLGDTFDALVRSSADVDVDAALAKAGLAIDREPRGHATSSISARLVAADGAVRVRSVIRGGAAERAGLDAGDELVALGGRRVTSTTLDAVLHGRSPGERVDVVCAREGQLLGFALTLDPPRLDRVRIRPAHDAGADARALRRAWIGEGDAKPAERTR